MNPSVKRLLGTVLLFATVGLACVLAARQAHAVDAANLFLTHYFVELTPHG